MPRKLPLSRTKTKTGSAARHLLSNPVWERIAWSVAAASRTLMARRFESIAGKALPFPRLKAGLLMECGIWRSLSFRLRSIRRPWGSFLAIDLRLKR